MMVDYVYVGGLTTDVGSHPPVIELYVGWRCEQKNKEKMGRMSLNGI